MKILTSLIALITLAGCAQSQPTTVKAVVGNPYACALLYRGEAPPQLIGALVTDPVAKAAALRAAFATAKPGDFIQVGYGVFDFGKDTNVILPSCTIRGMGRGQTILVGEVLSDSAGTNFALQNTVVEDLTLKNQCYDTSEDGRCTGFDSGPFTATIRRCDLWCTDWTVYSWPGNGNKLTLEDCTITTGRVGIAAENSGNGQDITLRRCTINGDASLSQSVGATSDKNTGGVFGVIARGGPLTMIDCEITIVGKASTYPSYTPRACAITDHGGGGSGPANNTVITLYNLRTSVQPNGADPTRCFDLDLQADFVQKALTANWPNCWGSAADKTLTKNW